MILSAQTIQKYCEHHNMVRPFCQRTVTAGMSYGLSSAGYDIRIIETVELYQGDFTLASTIERFIMPDHIMGMVCDKSSWARRGLAVQNTIIEPGWCGHLTLELTAHQQGFLTIHGGSPIAQIIFMHLDYPTDQPYTGKYQDQPAKPVPAKMEH